VWGREVDGIVLTFRLAGINNQNFLMRDEQTGSYWQQVSGIAISGPLRGKSLKLVHSDELTFGLLRSEQPGAEVLRPEPSDEAKYSPIDWERQFEKLPVVVPHAGEGFEPKDHVLALDAFGQAKAYRYTDVARDKLVRDRLGATPVMLVLGTDNDSVRAFRVPATDFYRTGDSLDSLMVDAATGSKWNFRGCATEGPSKGQCLEQINVTREYWFDWRSYHPNGAIYQTPR
jgi:hypothetical protein